MSDVILSVRELTEELRRSLEGRFPFVWVRGEVTNLTRPGSGHVYFSLKDQDAQLQCVWFRQRQGRGGQAFDPLTGEVFDAPRPAPVDLLRNGLDVLCAGRISVYAPRGQYQLAVELAQPAGEGLLAQAFEERKRKLAALGYFAAERKRGLPWDPQRVALITSPTGAAVHDFWQLAANRGSGARVRLFPALVQGAEAAPSLVRALEEANAQGWAQVIVLVRGGGSLEDLWAFNEESVAEAVFRSRLPVLAGIGHEVDVTLADLTADLRASTPSHAAQLLWPLRTELAQRLDLTAEGLSTTWGRQLRCREEALARCAQGLRWFAPQRRQARLQERLAGLDAGLCRAGQRWQEGKFLRLARLEQGLRAVGRVGRLDGPAARLTFLQARLRESLPRLLQGWGRERARLTAMTTGLWRERLTAAERRLERLDLELGGVDPQAPLRRGYALVRGPDGALLRSVAGVQPGAAVSVRLADGSLEAEVRQVRRGGE